MLGTIIFAAMASVSQPISLSAEKADGQVRLQVIGESDTAVNARYELEASSGKGNRSVQRGDVSLRPGQRAVLVTLGLGMPEAGWTARLKVTLDEAEYEQSLTGK